MRRAPPSLPPSPTQPLRILFVALVQASLLHASLASCDMHGLCKRVSELISFERVLCGVDEDCVSSATVDCTGDESLVNDFGCDGTDCIVVQSMAGDGGVSACASFFPPTRGTVLDEHGAHEISDVFSADALAGGSKPVVRDGLLYVGGLAAADKKRDKKSSGGGRRLLR